MSALSLTRSQQSSRGNNRCTARSIHEVPTGNFAARTTPSHPLIRSVTTPILHLPRLLSSDFFFFKFNHCLFQFLAVQYKQSSPILGWRSSECFSMCRSLSDFTYSPSLRGRRLKGKGKGVLSAREMRGAREEGRKETGVSFLPSLLARPGPRVSLAPKTRFPFAFKRLPRRLVLPRPKFPNSLLASLKVPIWLA